MNLFYKTKIIMYVSESIYKIYTLFLGTEKNLKGLPWEETTVTLALSAFYDCLYLKIMCMN